MRTKQQITDDIIKFDSKQIRIEKSIAAFECLAKLYIEDVDQFRIDPNFKPCEFVDKPIMNINVPYRIDDIKASHLIDIKDNNKLENTNIYLNNRYNWDIFKWVTLLFCIVLYYYIVYHLFWSLPFIIQF